MSDFPLFCPIDCPPNFSTFPKNNFKFEFQGSVIFQNRKTIQFCVLCLNFSQETKTETVLLTNFMFQLIKKKEKKKKGTLGTRTLSVLNKTDCFLSVTTYASTKSFIHISQCFNNIFFYFYVAYHKTSYNMGSTCTRIYFYFPVGYGLY